MTNPAIRPHSVEPELGDPSVTYELVDAVVTESTNASPATPDASSEDFEQAELDRFGYIPLYRHWIETCWWWEHKPWSMAQLFLYLQARANRAPRQAKHLLEIITIDRGCVATSFSKLAERAGLDRKTVTRYLGLLQKAGELKFLSRDKHGIMVRICHYERYARDKRQSGQRGTQPVSNAVGKDSPIPAHTEDRALDTPQEEQEGEER